MDAIDKNTLQVFSLGRFEVRRGGQPISQEEQRLNKRWRLFQILITYKGQALSSEQMYKYFSLEESVNPSEALKSLVFYLRRSLEKDKGKIKNGEQYIICSQGRYLFNEKSHYWLDAEVFENLCKKGRQVAEESAAVAIDMHLEALSLYREITLGKFHMLTGLFLPAIITGNSIYGLCWRRMNYLERKQGMRSLGTLRSRTAYCSPGRKTPY